MYWLIILYLVLVVGLTFVNTGLAALFILVTTIGFWVFIGGIDW